MVTQTKAEFHVRRREYDEAVVLYWKVIGGWRFLCNDEKRLEVQLILGNLLEKQDRAADAFSLFMSTFIEYLDHFRLHSTLLNISLSAVPSCAFVEHTSEPTFLGNGVR